MAREKIISQRVQPAPEDEQFNIALRPQTLDDCIGMGELLEKLRISIAAARQRNEPMEHVLLHGPPGLGKTTLAYVIAHEMGTHHQGDLRPGPDAAQRPHRHPDQPGAPRRAVHRRDPPPAAGRRGVHLPGDGGLQGRLRGRFRHAQPDDQPAAQALHADRGHHAGGPAHPAAADAVRHHAPPGILVGGGPAAPRRGCRPRCSSSTTTPPALETAGRRGRAARRGSPTACSAAAATTPRSRATAGSPSQTVEAGAEAGRHRRAGPGRPGPPVPADRSSTSTRAGRSASRPSPPRSARRPTRWWTWSSRSCSRSACSPAPAAAAWPRSRRYEHLGVKSVPPTDPALFEAPESAEE